MSTRSNRVSAADYVQSHLAATNRKTRQMHVARIACKCKRNLALSGCSCVALGSSCYGCRGCRRTQGRSVYREGVRASKITCILIYFECVDSARLQSRNNCRCSTTLIAQEAIRIVSCVCPPCQTHGIAVGQSVSENTGIRRPLGLSSACEVFPRPQTPPPGARGRAI